MASRLIVAKNFFGHLADEPVPPGTVRVPLDLSCLHARYALAMETINEGEVDKGLRLLREVAYLPDNLLGNPECLGFSNACLMQLALMNEMRLQPGDSLGKDMIARVASARVEAENVGDEFVSSQAAGILKRWLHYDVNGNPVIAQHPQMSPLALQLEPTNACNLKCSRCPRSRMKRPVGFMEPALFQQALEEWGSRLRVLVLPNLLDGPRVVLERRGELKLFFMGEPLLHPQIHQYITAGRLMGCAVSIQTNGALFRDIEIIDRVLEAEPSSIGISLGGMNGASGGSERDDARQEEVREAVKNLHERRSRLGRDKLTTIFACSILPGISEKSATRAAAFLETIREYVDGVGFAPLMRNNAPVFFDVNDKRFAYAKALSQLSSLRTLFCKEALTKLNVLWDGTVTPCSYDINGEMSLGHVADGIDKIWKSEKAVSLRQSLLSRDVSQVACKRCLGLFCEQAS